MIVFLRITRPRIFKIIHNNHATIVTVVDSFWSFVVGFLAHRFLVTHTPPHPLVSGLPLVLHRECVPAPHPRIYFCWRDFQLLFPKRRTSCTWRLYPKLVPTPYGALRLSQLFGWYESQMSPRVLLHQFLWYCFLHLSRP